MGDWHPSLVFLRVNDTVFQQRHHPFPGKLQANKVALPLLPPQAPGSFSLFASSPVSPTRLSVVVIPTLGTELGRVPSAFTSDGCLVLEIRGTQRQGVQFGCAHLGSQPTGRDRRSRGPSAVTGRSAGSRKAQALQGTQQSQPRGASWSR